MSKRKNKSTIKPNTPTFMPSNEIIGEHAYRAPDQDAPIAPVATSADCGEPTVAEPRKAYKRRGRARSHNLDRVTAVSKAACRVTHTRTSIMAIEGWYARLKQANAAEHAANSFAKYAYGDRQISYELAPTALEMTIARAMDYGKTAEEAAELIGAAIRKKTAGLTAS